MTGPLVLGIETSCDETGVALVRGNELLVDTVASSMAEHARFGGIIPEIASRAHLQAFVPTLQATLAGADVALSQVDAIAVTAGPGLQGPLTIGLSAAKALALATGKPLHGVNHVVGHAVVDQVVDGDFPARTLALVVSGGHSSLLLFEGGPTCVRELGSTLDDAAGEAFDKVGRLLGLPYPGGPHIDALAREGDPHAIAFPRGLSKGRELARHPYDFSFSGLKTAVARWLEAREDARQEVPVADVCASFAQAVADALVTKTLRACQIHQVQTLVIGGGFSANSQLRAMARERCAAAGIDVRIPPIRYCTDNGAMIAALGAAVVAAGLPPSPLDIGVDSAMPLEMVQMLA